MKPIVILGGGIAGLSSGWLLKQLGVEFLILEKQAYVGGLARSFTWHGFSCDFAAHRFFTNNFEVLQRVLQLVPMGRHIRRSRILLNHRWMRDPLDLIELALGLPPGAFLGLAWSYLVRNQGLPESNFENYVVRRYGRRLYELFFRPYTEKLFGIPGGEISVLWARQKVRLANPFDALRQNTKTKFSYFYYPRQGGYGAIANEFYSEIASQVRTEATVKSLETEAGRVSHVLYQHAGREHRVPAEAVITTLPLTVTGRMLGQDFPMRFQKVEAVYLWINRPWVSDNHWHYFIDDDICVNRLVEFKNMSAEGAPAETTVICAEVTQPQAQVADRVADDLVRLGLVRREEILDTKVVREEYAYPVYDETYDAVLQAARRGLGQYRNLHLVGRAAEFEHREVDDNFAAAVDTVKQIMKEHSSTVSAPAPLAPVKPPAEVYAVVLAHNNYADTQECLKTVLESDYPHLKLVLVDNGSSDGTPERARREFPLAHVIETGSNLGVPAGYNVGFVHALQAGAQFVLLLNNDTTIAPAMVTRLVRAAEADERSGILMPKVLYYGSRDQFWSIGGHRRLFPPAIVMTDKRKEMADVPRMIEFAPSCGLLIHRRAFELAGLFDPGYLYWYDDWDFCERVRAHGLHIEFVPQAEMWHKVSRTTGGPRSSLFWHTYGASAVRFHRRHGRPAWLSIPAHLAYIVLRDLVWQRNLKFWPDFAAGMREGMTRALGEMPRINQGLREAPAWQDQTSSLKAAVPPGRAE